MKFKSSQNQNEAGDTGITVTVVCTLIGIADSIPLASKKSYSQASVNVYRISSRSGYEKTDYWQSETRYAWIETRSDSANSRKKRRSTIAVAESQSMEHSRPARRQQRQSAAQRASSSKTTTTPLLPSKSHTARRKPAGTAISRHAIELIIRNTWSCLLTNKTPQGSLVLWKD